MSDLTCPTIAVVASAFAVLSIGQALLNRYTTVGFAGLLRNGKPALGILLRVGNAGLPVAGLTPAVESRTVTLDIEIPGAPPYETQVDVQFYANLRASVLPGATVELRVDPKDRQRVIIVGPGSGFDNRAFAPPQP